MSIREKLDAIWNDQQVRCPRHIVWWTNLQEGRAKPEAEDLFYAKGRRVDLNLPDRGLER